MVPREELLREVWHGIAVTDHVLAQALHTARKLLGDSASKPTILRTVRGRGVQFVAATHVAVDPALGQTPFVGREVELSRIHSRLRLGSASSSAFVGVVSGEAGIGKSAFCREVSNFARHQGWTVLLGKCSQMDGAPAFMPWRQIIADFRRQSAPELAAKGRPQDFQEVLPLGDSAVAPSAAWSEQSASYSRESVLERAWSFWKERSLHEPLLFVVEDIHWADESSMRLLRFACESLGWGRLGILFSFRGSNLLARAKSRGELGILGVAADESIELRPISYPESCAIARALGSSLSDSELSEVHDQSGGNPLFWHRLYRLRIEGHRPDERLPLTVRAAVLEHLETLERASVEALQVAAVVGPDFSIPEVSCALSVENEKVMEYLEPAIQSEIVRPIGGASGRIEFVHAVVRDAIYEELGEVRRREIHSVIAQLWPSQTTLEGRTRRAHHYLAGIPVVPAEIAVPAAVESAWEAVQSLAFEDALPILTKVEALAPSHSLDSATQCKFLLALAECQLRQGDRQKAALNLRDSAALAEAAGMPEILSEVALRATPGLLAIDTLRRDALTEDLLRRAHEYCNLPETRAVLAARLAMVLYWKPRTGPERRRLVDEALRLSGDNADAARRGQILAYKIGSLWETDGLLDRRRDAQEIVSLGSVSGSGELEALGHIFLITCLLEAGAGRAVEAQVDALAELVASGARVGPQISWYLPMYRASAALNRGQLSDAARLLGEAAELGRRTGGQNFVFSNAGLLAGIAYFSGASADAALAVEEMLLRFPDFWPWRTGRLFLLSATERATVAMEELPELAAELLDSNDQQMFRLGCLVQLANVAADCGDATTGSRLRRELVPYARRLSVAGYGVMTFGTVARPLGNLLCQAGDLDQGIAMIEQAARLCENSSSFSWGTICKADLVCALRQRAAPGDGGRAARLEGEIREFGARTGVVIATGRIDSERSFP